MKQCTNDQKIRNYKIRKILRILILSLLFITVVLSILSLFWKLLFLYPLGTFIIAVLLTKYRNSLEFLDVKSRE